MIPARISSTEHNKGLDLTLTPSALDCVTTIYNKCAPLGREIVYLCVSEEGRVIDFLVGKLFICVCLRRGLSIGHDVFVVVVVVVVVVVKQNFWDFLMAINW